MKSRWLLLISGIVLIAMITVATLSYSKAAYAQKAEEKKSNEQPHLITLIPDGTILTSYALWKDRVSDCLIFDIANRRFIIRDVAVSDDLLMKGDGIVVRSKMESKVGGENIGQHLIVINKYENNVSEIILREKKNAGGVDILKIVNGLVRQKGEEPAIDIVDSGMTEVVVKIQ